MYHVCMSTYPSNDNTVYSRIEINCCIEIADSNAERNRTKGMVSNDDSPLVKVFGLLETLPVSIIVNNLFLKKKKKKKNEKKKKQKIVKTYYDRRFLELKNVSLIVSFFSVLSPLLLV